MGRKVYMPTARLPIAAAKIADIIASVDTDDRGVMFRLVCKGLQKRTQYFTARCFDAVGILYRGVENTEDSR